MFFDFFVRGLKGSGGRGVAGGREQKIDVVHLEVGDVLWRE